MRHWERCFWDEIVVQCGGFLLLVVIVLFFILKSKYFENFGC